MKDFDIKTDPWPLVSDRLQCRTPASKTSGLAPVLLEVEDRYTAEYKINGTSAGHQFHYKVQLIHVHFHFSFFLKDFLKVCLYFIFQYCVIRFQLWKEYSHPWDQCLGVQNYWSRERTWTLVQIWPCLLEQQNAVFRGSIILLHRFTRLRLIVAIVIKCSDYIIRTIVLYPIKHKYFSHCNNTRSKNDFRKNSTAILCLTGKMATSEIRYETSDLKATYPSLVTAAYVRVQIDSSNTSSTQMFAYVNDSTITSIQPKTSIVRYKEVMDFSFC